MPLLSSRLARAAAIRAIALTAVFGAAAVGAQAPSHVYRLDGSLADDNGGPSLVAVNAPTFVSEAGADGYRFPVGGGFTVSNALASGSVYSVELRFLFDQATSFRRILDFKNAGTDTGPYTLNGFLNYYPIGTGSSPFPAGQLGTVVFTRDAANVFTGYLNGVSQLSFSDNGSDAVADQPGNILRFFLDNGNNELGSGFVDYIRLYDTALTADQVAALADPGATTTTPEPATLALLGTGLLAVGVARRRRARS